MTSSEFVERLKALAPDEKDIFEIEPDKEFVEQYLSSYSLKRINDDTVSNDPLLDLIYKYDISPLDISMIGFNNKEDVLETDKYIFFGKEEANALVINKITNEVILLNSEDPDYIISKCSKDTDSFLEALLLVEEFNQQMFFDEDLVEDQIAIMAKAKEIAEIAGGEKYLNFHLNSLGYEGQ